MAVKTRKKTSKAKKVTLSEFRAWLEGVEELQNVNWSPTKEQWTIIRQKIDMIIIEERVVEKVVERPVTYTEHTAMVQPTVPVVQAEMTPAAREMLNTGRIPGQPNVKMEGDKIKTPNIDTGAGGYESSFT